MSFILDSALDAQRLADCRAGDAEREAAERALFTTIGQATARAAALKQAEHAVDLENCCDTVPGDIDVPAVIRESERGAGFFVYPAVLIFIVAGVSYLCRVIGAAAA